MPYQTNCCLLTRGDLFISEREDCEIPELSCETKGKSFKKIGNVLSCSITNVSEIFGTENKFVKTNDSCARKSLVAVSISMTIGCASKKNLIMALSEEILEEEESGSFEEKFCATELKKCDFFPLSKKAPVHDSVLIYLLDIDNNIISSLEKDLDFSVSNSGVEILRDIVLGEDDEEMVSILVDYDYNSSGFHKIDLSDKLSGYKRLYFKGTNYSEGGDGLFDARFHKVLLSPINNFDLISADDFFTITLTGVVEKVNGSFYEITKQEE